MARTTEKQVTDIDGNVRTIRTIEADRIRIEHPDGTIEELEDFPALPRAEEWPWSPPERSPEWKLFIIPLDKVMRIGLQAAPRFITLLSENGEALLKLGGITIGIQMSAAAQEFLMGNEIPLDSQ